MRTILVGVDTHEDASELIDRALPLALAFGSTVYVVWTQDRVDTRDPGSFDLDRDVRSLLDAPGEDILMVKISKYFSL